MKQLTKTKIKLLIVIIFSIIIDLALLIWTICDTKYEFLPMPLRISLMVFSVMLFPSLLECITMVIKKTPNI